MYDINATAKILGLSRNHLYDLYQKGKVFMKKVDGKLYTIDEYLIAQFGGNAEEIQQYSLCAKEAAFLTGIEYQTFRRKVRKGEIHHIRIADRNRFDPNKLKIFKETYKTKIDEKETNDPN